MVDKRPENHKWRRLALVLAALLLFLSGALLGSGELTEPDLLEGFLAGDTASTRPDDRRRSDRGHTPPQEPRAPWAGAARGDGADAIAGAVRTGDGSIPRGLRARPGAEPRPESHRGGPGSDPESGVAPLRGGVESRRAPNRGGGEPASGDDSAPAGWGGATWPGEVLLRPSGGVSESSFAAFAEFTDSEFDPRLSGCLLLKELPAGVEEKTWADFLESEGLARSAYPNFRCWPAWVPNDPDLGSQWAVDKINLTGAWDITRGNASLVIAICDTGIDTDHPDLAAKIVAGRNTADDPETANVEDIHGHGTAVAGMAAAVTNNAVQIAGVAPSCQIMPVKISNRADGEATLADMVDGIAWAHANGAHVVNCSYNGVPDTDFYDAMDDEGVNCDASGAVLVMAAGNNSADMGDDKPWDRVLWIGSTDNADALSSFSQYGWALDLVAPGELVHVSAMGGGDAVTASGTSFASPCVAGVLGLMYDASQFTLTPAEYRAALYSTCEDLGAAGKDETFGWGRVDAHAAVVEVGTPVARASASPDRGPAPLTVKFSGSSNMDAVKAITYTWDFGEGGAASGKTATHTYSVIGTYTATLTVEDSEGLSDTDSVTIKVEYGNVPENMWMWEGQRVNYRFAPTGGVNPPTVLLAAGSLPPGMSLSNNRLTGRARRRGSWTFTVSIDDGVSTPSDRTVRIRVTRRGFGRFRRYTWR